MTRRPTRTSIHVLISSRVNDITLPWKLRLARYSWITNVSVYNSSLANQYDLVGKLYSIVSLIKITGSSSKLLQLAFLSKSACQRLRHREHCKIITSVSIRTHSHRLHNKSTGDIAKTAGQYTCIHLCSRLQRNKGGRIGFVSHSGPEHGGKICARPE